MNFEKWEKRDALALSNEEIEAIIESCRIAHNDYINFGLACGIRAAFRALAEIGGDRTEYTIERAYMHSNGCAALAVSIICCLNPFKDDKIEFERYMASDWGMIAYGKDKQVEIKLIDRSFESYEEILEAADDELFDYIEVLPLRAE